MYYKNCFTLLSILAASMLLFACETPQVTLTPIPATATFITPSPTNTSTLEPIITRPADVIFHNGVILTIEASQPQAQAVAIQGNKILAVGSNTDILALKGPDTVVIDLQGKTLMPGFIESHNHFIINSVENGMSIEDIMDTLLSLGLTSVTEIRGHRKFIEAMLQAEQEGKLRVRVNVFADYNYGFLTNGKTTIDPAWHLDHEPILDPSRLLRIPGVKIFADGAGIPPRGCPYYSFPNPDEAYALYKTYGLDLSAICGSPRGDLYLTEAQLTEAIQGIQDRGYRAAFHAMGDATIDAILKALEAVLKGESNTKYRHQIHHNSALRPDQIEQYVQMDIIASVRSMFNTCEADEYIAIYGEDRYEWAVNRYQLPLLDLHAIAEGDFARGDVNDRTRSGQLNPIFKLYGMVTRQQLRKDGSVCKPPDWVAQYPISVKRALEMLTIESAYAVSMEDYVGSILPGKFADLIIISDNPLTVDPDQLIDLQVWMTMINGKVEYCAAGKEAFCPSTVSSNNANAIPIGYIDIPVPNETISGTIEIAGWALDEIKIDRVEIYLDGQFIGNAAYGNPRPDVEHDYPGRPGTPNFGYVSFLDTTSYSNGSHIIEAFAINSSGNKSPLIPGKLKITVNN